MYMHKIYDFFLNSILNAEVFEILPSWHKLFKTLLYNRVLNREAKKTNSRCNN